ncbi:MAG: hypothetical protein AB1352_02775 [Patescibacteria group bacterium]
METLQRNSEITIENKIILPNNQQLIQKLENKLTDYKQRLQSLEEQGGCFGFNEQEYKLRVDTISKATILKDLLENKQIEKKV